MQINNLIGKDILNVHIEDGRPAILPNFKGNYSEIIEKLDE